jgi:hypothetical protein
VTFNTGEAPKGRIGLGRPLTWIAALAIILPATYIALWLLLVPACACTRPAPPPSSPLEGVIVAVDSAGLGDVRGFDLRVQGGVYPLTLGPLENATEFPPGHLAEHLASSEPVRAYFRESNGERVVYRLEDATTGTPAAPTPSAAGAT